MAGKFMNKFLNFIGLEENIIEEPTEEMAEENQKGSKEELI
mgnify:FL=1